MCSDMALEDTPCLYDHFDEVVEGDCSVVVLPAVFPQLRRHIIIKTLDMEVSDSYLVEGILKLSLFAAGVFVQALKSELVEDFIVVLH